MIRPFVFPDSAAATRYRAKTSAAYVSTLREKINIHLETLMPRESRCPVNLYRAIRYSLLGGGKRVRPLLCVVVSEAAKGRGRAFAQDAGCAIEMVHAASLILDDLPCMDDGTTRRGRPTAHVKFGQATAILASFALLNRAFGVISESAADPGVVNQATKVLSGAVGADGMIAGQEIDLNERAVFGDITTIEELNLLKTGTLFVAAGHIGALAAGLEPEAVEAVRRFSRHFGLAFQTADDLIDQMSDAQAAGKDVRKDFNKPTILSIAGEPAARSSCAEHIQAAFKSLETSGLDTGGFVALVDSVFGQAE